MAQPDATRALARRGQEHLGRAGVRVLLEEVMLHLPHAVEPHPVGQLHLLERVGQQPLLRPFFPWARELVLVEQTEPHAAMLGHRGCSPQLRESARWMDRNDCSGEPKRSSPAESTRRYEPFEQAA